MGGKAFCYMLLDRHEEPFYVGIGTKNSRPYDHIRHAKNGWKGRRYSLIRKMLREGLEVPVVFISEGLTVECAKRVEIAVIAEFGRWPNGPLLNLTDGGDSPLEQHPLLGTTRSQETREKLRIALTGRKNGPLSIETRAKISAAQIGKRRGPHSDEHKANIAKGLRLSWSDPTVHKIRVETAGMAGRKHSEATKERMRIAALLRITDSDRERMRRLAISNIGTRHSLATRAKMSASHLRRYATEVQTNG